METMLDYIKQTPDVVNNIINNSKAYTKELVDFYKANNYESIYLIASGSSYNGCLIAKQFMEHILGKEVRLQTPFTFYNHETLSLDKTMLIAVSQSGCSTNTLDCIKLLKEKGYKTACLVGRENNDAKNIADLTVNWQVGEEKIGFVTKGVTSLACFLYVFALELALSLNIINETKIEHAKSQLLKTQTIQPEIVNNTIELFNANKDDFINRSKAIFLSSGPNYATVTEGALKIKETSCIVAEQYEIEEFLHGPLYPSTPDDLIIIVDNNDDPSSDRMVEIANALLDVTTKVYMISSTDKFNNKNHQIRTSADTCCHTSPLYKLSALQTLAYLMTEATNKYEPHENIKQFKKANKVATKSKDNLYLNLQNIK